MGSPHLHWVSLEAFRWKILIWRIKTKQKKLKNFNHEDRILIYAHLPYFISCSFHEELQNNDRFIIFLKKIKYFLRVPCVSVISRRQFSLVVGAFREPRLQWGIGRRVVFYSDFLLVHVVKKGMCDKTPRSSIREARWREVKIAQENGDREAGKIRG